MSAQAAADDERWPELPWREWQPTIDTLHRWLQVAGKVRMALTPPLEHWWHITLYVTPRGLTTSPIPIDTRQFEISFDFIDHRLEVSVTDGGAFAMPLAPISVATFYKQLMAGLRGLGIEVEIKTTPSDVPDPIPFESDETHASYEPMHAHLMWRALLDADRLMKAFQAGFPGTASPVHLYWGSLDLATSRFSDRAGEESAIGWWPASEEPGPAFYAYTTPAPDGFASAPVRPEEAFWSTRYGEFILPNDAIRTAPDRDAKVLEFFDSTVAAGAVADLGA
jgi:uncharacterized protein DUF5996